MSLIAARSAMVGGAKSAPLLKTCNLKGLSSNRLNIDINGLGNVSFGGWVRNLLYFWTAPGWREAGSWGSTYFGKNENTVEVRFGTGSSSSKKRWNYVTPTNEWTHLYALRQGDQMSLYINGTLISTLSASSQPLKNNGAFSLTNGMYDGINIEFDFSTVGLAFFSRALTENEINAAMNAVTVDLTKAPYNDSCVMAVNCTEGSGNRVKELVSGNYIELSQTPVWDVDIPTA